MRRARRPTVVVRTGVIGMRDEPCSDPPFPRPAWCGSLRDALNHVQQNPPTKQVTSLAAGRACFQYPAGAAFGGYKISGIGRENHRMMLDHYSQTKNLLVSYDPKPLGLF